MKKNRNLGVILSFLLVFFLVLTGLFSMFYSYVQEAARQEKEEWLEESAGSINQHITAMLALTQQDFQYLIENESALLFDMLENHRSHEEAQLFLTDSAGKILVASTGSPHGTLPLKAVSKGTEMAREGKTFSSDLEGFFEEQRVIRVLILEKEHSQTHRQRVGLIVLSLPEGATSTLAQSLFGWLLLGFFILISLAVFYAVFVYRRFLNPLWKLDAAAEAFAKGDFTRRLPEEGSGSITPLFRAYNEMAEKVEKNENIRQTFVSNVSHDLRTPLTTISGFVQNMRSGAIPAEKLDHYYKIILDEVNRLSRLVQTLLETSRMTAGERKYNFAPMDLCELGRVTLLSFEKRLEEKKIEVFFFSSEDSISVHADQDAIQQVIYNLLDNAIKFTPEAGRLSLEITSQEKKAFFAVTNSGEGIPAEELSHLFERFYKSDRSRGLDKKGMGLGLFIAKSVISAHGEEIWVESKVGSYTQFVFSLPLTRPVKKNR